MQLSYSQEIATVALDLKFLVSNPIVFAPYHCCLTMKLNCFVRFPRHALTLTPAVPTIPVNFAHIYVVSFLRKTLRPLLAIPL